MPPVREKRLLLALGAIAVVRLLLTKMVSTKVRSVVFLHLIGLTLGIGMFVPAIMTLSSALAE
jgi:hypothetical protein